MIKILIIFIKMLFQYLNLDCVLLILSKTSYITNISFKLTCKCAKDIQPRKFKNIFIERLLEHNIVPSYEIAIKFCNNLYETGAYVAGSFILDCLYNTNYHQDIDIYDQTTLINDYVYDRFKKFGDQNLKFTQSLYNLNFLMVTSSSGPNPILRSYLHNSYPGLENQEDKMVPNVHTITLTKDAIQIIPIALTLKENERSFIPRFISSSFDLEICQCIFNGKNIYIKNVNKMLNKFDFIKPNTRFMESVYERNNITESLLTENRMEKYISRGFDIKLHPDYTEINNFIEDILASNKYNNGTYQNNIKYIDNEEIDLSKYDYDMI